MYYRGGGESTAEVTCLATSKNGVDWKRPSLGLFEFNGSRDNNIIFDVRDRRKSYGECHNFTPFLDTNPTAQPDERYKALALGHDKNPEAGDRALLALASPDGIRWHHMTSNTVMSKGAFDSQNLAFWDFAGNCYSCYSRVGINGIRSVQLTTSSDFLKWNAPVPLDFGPAPLEHFYTNAIEPYPGIQSLYIGFPMRFVPQRKVIGDDARPIDGLSDALLISSRDGVHFDRTFPEAFIRPGLTPENWGKPHGNNTPAWGTLQTSPAETSVYWSENYVATPHVRRGVVRTDGFASVSAGSGGGEFITRPVRLSGDELVLNYSTSALGSVRVKLLDTDGKILPNGALPEVYGDEVERRLKLPEDAAGRDVRLFFDLSDAELYSFR